MKKLTLIAVMVMFSIAVFSSNNEPKKNGQNDKTLLLNSEIDNDKSFDLVEKETSLKDLKNSEIQLPATSDTLNNTEKVSEGTKVDGENVLKRQCGGCYFIDLLDVEYIEYIPDLRVWLT